LLHPRQRLKHSDYHQNYNLKRIRNPVNPGSKKLKSWKKNLSWKQWPNPKRSKSFASELSMKRCTLKTYIDAYITACLFFKSNSPLNDRIVNGGHPGNWFIMHVSNSLVDGVTFSPRCLSLYQKNMDLKAFSFEHDPHAMVVTCVWPAGATCKKQPVNFISKYSILEIVYYKLYTFHVRLMS